MNPPLEHINDPAHLKQIIGLQQAEISRLMKRLEVLTRQLAELKGTSPSEALQAELFDVQAHLAKLQKQLYGPKSERRRGSGGEEGQAAAQTSEKKPGDKKPRKGHGPRSQPKLPIEERFHDLDEPDKACPACGGGLEEMKGQFEESEEIDVIERRYILVKHKRRKYRCRCQSCVETALGPTRLIPGGRYSIAFGVQVAVDKYQDSLPLTRQVSRMARAGLVVDEQTLFDQLYAVAMLAEPTWQALRRHILASGVVHADETPWKLMGKGKSQSFWVWTLSSHDASFYDIRSSRAHTVADELLGGFEGVVVADGMSAYGALVELRKRTGGARITLAGCLAHARRKFIEAERNFYKEAHPFVELFRKLYAIEREAHQLAAEGHPPDGPGLRTALLEQRRHLRAEKSHSVMDELHQLLKTTPARPTSGLGEALGYALGQWSALKVFLEHPAVDVDNNRAERQLRLPVVGRKNFYGNRSARGLRAAAILYSLLATARDHGVAPQPWLEALVRRAQSEPGAVLFPWDFRPD